MTDLITADLVRLDADLGADKHDVIRALAGVVVDADRATDVEQIVEDALAREAKSPTGLKDGIAIPHCRTAGVDEPDAGLRPALPAGRLRRQGRPGRPGLPDHRPRGRRQHPPADPHQARPRAGAARSSPTACARPPPPRTSSPWSRRRRRGARRRREAARPRPTPRRRLGAPPSRAASSRSPRARPASPTPTWPPRPSRPRPSAPASTIDVETQGSAGSTPLPPATIAAADAVIFAVDVGVRDRGRFAGKPLVSSGVKRPIDDGDAMIAEALRYADDPAAPRVEGSGADGGERRRATTRVLGRHGPPRADDRRVLHDPVRRGRRPADRPRLPARRLRDRRALRRDRAVRHRGQQRDLRPARPPAPRPRPRAASARACWPTSAPCSSSSARRRSASSSRPSPATSPTRSPTAPASRPAS